MDFGCFCFILKAKHSSMDFGFSQEDHGSGWDATYFRKFLSANIFFLFCF